MNGKYHKKIQLGVHERRTKWAPFWAVIRKFGAGGAPANKAFQFGG